MNNRLSFFIKYIAVVAIAVTFAGGHQVSVVYAADDFEVSAWIPYWKTKEGIQEAKDHLEVFTELHPFGYSVKENGKLNDLANIKNSDWKRLFREAKYEGVKIIPSIMWSNSTAIHAILSDEDDREDHIDEIVKMVKKGKYDGVDIDYEGKLAATKDYFSLFLKELKKELGDKELTCTIEARTPPSSLYTTIPANIEYANDYDAIAKYCDRVKIMGYDQGRADIKLNNVRKGEPYNPVADTEWVKKVLDLTTKSIPKEKIVLGIPTYGYEYEVVVSPNWYKSYKRLWSVSNTYAENLADEVDVKPSENKAGEMSFAYAATTTPNVYGKYKVPKSTSNGNKAAAQALAYANATGKTTTFRLVWWSDARAIEQKVKLAKQYGLKGVVLFKLDGRTDPDMWDIFN